MRTVMPGTVAEFEFAVSNKNGGRANFSDALEQGDFKIFRRGSTTPRSSLAGLTAAAVLGSVVGLYRGSLDVSNNTDAGFYANGTVIQVVLSPDTETADGEAVTEIVFEFAIGGEPTPDMPVVGLVQGGTVDYVTLPATASGTTGDYKGAMVRVRHAGGAWETRHQAATAYGTGGARRFHVDPPFDTAPDGTSGSEAAVWLYLLPPAPATNVQTVNVSTTSQTSIRNALLNWEPFTGFSLAKLLRVLGIIFAGTKSGGNTATETYTAPAGGTTVVADVDSTSDRTSVTTDASGTP